MEIGGDNIGMEIGGHEQKHGSVQGVKQKQAGRANLPPNVPYEKISKNILNHVTI